VRAITQRKRDSGLAKDVARQAAERLHLSQPPLSRAIRELEERLGCRLFERHAGGMVLTGAGRALRPYALKVERLLRDAEQAMAAQAAPVRVRLGLTSAVEPAWFNRLTETAGVRFTEQGFSVVSDTSPRLVRQLRAGRLDTACIALPTEAGELQVHKVDRLPMVVALCSSDPLARRRRLRLADLATTPIFWFERARQPAFYDHCERVFACRGLTARRLREPSDLPAVVDLDLSSSSTR
jgi:DNA-binding transcriptional LysR family regulator